MQSHKLFYEIVIEYLRKFYAAALFAVHPEDTKSPSRRSRHKCLPEYL